MNSQTKTTDESVSIDREITALKKVTDPLKQLLEAEIAKAPIEAVLTHYDDEAGFIMDSEKVAVAGAEYVLKGLIGSLCYNVYDPNRFGHKQFNAAMDQVDQASERDAANSNAQTQDNLHGRIEWLAQMDVQIAYRKHLTDLVTKIYTAMTDERYVVRGAASAKPNTPEQSLVSKLKERRKAAAS